MSGQEWRLRAACRSADPDAPFAREGSPEERGFIASFCRPCPVRRDCLEFALQRTDPGVYGGMTPRRRTQEKRLRQLGSHVVRACGSDAGYHRHRRAKEDPCRPCLVAHNAKNHKQYRAKKDAA